MHEHTIIERHVDADDEAEYLEFIVTETDEDGRETTWEWDGNRWHKLA